MQQSESRLRPYGSNSYIRCELNDNRLHRRAFESELHRQFKVKIKNLDYCHTSGYSVYSNYHSREIKITHDEIE